MVERETGRGFLVIGPAGSSSPRLEAEQPPGRREMTDLPPGGEPADGQLAFKALIAFTIVLVLAPQEFFPALGQLRIAFVAGIVALSAHILGRSKGSRAARAPTELKIVLTILVWAVLCIPASYWPGGVVIAMTDRYLKTVAIFWLLGQVVCSVQRLRALFWTIGAITVPLALTGVKSYLSGAFVQNRVAGYVSGMTSNPNDLALTLNLFIPLTAALALTAARPWQRTLAWGIIGLSVAGVLVTFSRGGFLTLVAEGGLLLLLLMRRRAVKAIAGLLLCAVLALVVLPSGFGTRMATILNMNADDTGSSRDRWRDTVAATQFVVAHPIVGGGLGLGALAMNETRGALWFQVHNTYLNYGVDLGVPGLLLFVALVATSLRSARRIERLSTDTVAVELPAFASGIRVSLSGFVVAAFFHPVPYHFYFYFIAGLSVALKTIAARQFCVSGTSAARVRKEQTVHVRHCGHRAMG